ncbi:glycosyltransferase family 4 protein [Enterococcus casseliflavus]|nr:glycosyltransferase family 4 protein [Enterococcus casseliflavus]MBO1145873.1 glycosyltransferase family 4 protein [Enterococcus casseliflavus]
MRKVLMVASVASMIDLFNMNNIKILQDMGYSVEVACNFQEGSITSQERINNFKEELESKNIKYYDIPIPRSIVKIKKITESYLKLKKIINDNKYELIHCHSPIGSVISRICAIRFRKKGLKVIYTAHGFHFYKGASIEKWLIYYPIEKILSYFTDCIITINQEDYNFSQNKMNAQNVAYIPGIGIDVKKIWSYSIPNRDEKFTLISVGQLSQRKNHQVVIESLALLKERLNIDSIQYLICGLGELDSDLKMLVENLGISQNVVFLGFQENVIDYLKSADCFIFPSLQEGLPVSLMEAMAVPLPVICSKIRGNVDLIDNNKGGILVQPNDIKRISEAIEYMYANENIREEFRKYNYEKVKLFDTSIVNEKMFELYSFILKERY